MNKSSEDSLDLEICLLKGGREDISVISETSLVKNLISGDCLSVIRSEFCQSLLIRSDDIKSTDSHVSLIQNEIDEFVLKQPLVKQLDLFCVGIASLQSFILHNWTGPKSNKLLPEDSFCVPWLQSIVRNEKLDGPSVINFYKSLLDIDGESVSSSTNHSELLVLAQFIFNAPFKFPSRLWWLMRCLYIHQQFLDEHSSTLQGKLFDLSQKLLKFPWILENRDLRVQLHLEIARINLHYGRVVISEDHITACLKLLNMSVELVGSLGKRTYYQLKEVSQLTVKLKLDNSERRVEDMKSVDFPKDVLLNDDVRLPKISFSDPSVGEFPHLLPLEQATLLAVFVQKKKSQAKDRLQKEELLPYLNCLLAHPKVWAVQYSSLLFRSRLESDHRRTVERCLLQTQALMKMEDNGATLTQRLELFYCSYSPPEFVVAADCASLFLSIGAVQSALDLYLKLEMWEEVIACYNHLKLRHRAADIIREQMKKGETVKLWCYLGDATDDVNCYSTAWDMSNEKSAQAQRHWGMFYFNRQRYGESIPHLKKSLEINSLQIPMWFRLGYAALMEQQLEESAAAYRSYCSLEPDSFEAWNNLAKAYILLGQKQKAYTALHEAVKCNYEMWQVWDNLMAVSSDCGDFEGVIHCYHRILDLKEKHIDEPILSVLATVVIKGLKDCKGQPASNYKKKTLELFGRITSKVMSNAVVWQLYAKLTASLEDQSPVTRTKTTQYLQRAHMAALQDTGWYREYPSARSVLKLCVSLGEAYLECSSRCLSSRETVQLLASAKMSLRTVLSKLQQEYTDISTGQISSEITDDYKSLQETFENIQNQIMRLQETPAY